MAKSRGFLAELRRRHVYRVAVAYAVAGWLLIEIATQVFPVFHMPDWTAQLVVLLIVIGFPIAVILAWAFELTPDGVRRTEPMDSPDARAPEQHRRVGRTLDFVIIAVLALAVAVLAWQRWRPHAVASTASVAASQPAPAVSAKAKPGAATIPAKSIAVLPFVNDSGDKDEQFLSDGLSEDLITALAQFGGLKVISRESAFQYRDSKLKPSRIGRELGVAHLLEGSVRRVGGTVRISATLVNAADGSVLWSQRYDRPYRDLFALQDAITRAVADALKARLLDTPGAVVQSDRPPGGSLEAYTAYLKGMAGEYQNSRQGLHDAIAAYEEALRLDPRYAAAQARLAHARADLAGSFLSGKARQSALARARVEANAAAALNPDSVQVHLARGFVSAVDLDFAGVETEARRALQLAPNNPEAMSQMSSVYSFHGEPGKALRMLRQALQRDPRNVIRYIELAGFLGSHGHPDEAVKTMQDAIALQPGATWVHAGLARYETLRGDAAAALAAARQESGPGWREIALAQALQIGPDRAAADAALQQLVAHQADFAAYFIAEAYALRRDPDNMFKWLQRAWRNRDPYLGNLAHDPFLKPYRDDSRFIALVHKMGLPTPATTPAQAGTSATKHRQ